jgi:hypothetical protein
MISPHELDDWLRGYQPQVAERTLLAAGLELGDLSAAYDKLRFDLPAPVTPWRLDAGGLVARRAVDPYALSGLIPDVQGLRLAVTTDAEPADIVRRLLATAAVASAFIAVERPAWALRRRPWHWPLRVGLVGFPPGAAEAILQAIGDAHASLAGLLDIARFEDEPGAVDVAVIERPLLDAVALLARQKLVANALLVLDEPVARPPVTDALLASARAATGASASALIPPRDVAGMLAGLVREASHANGFDVALTKATERELLLWAEPAAMALAALPHVAQRTAREVEHARAVAPEASAELESAAFELHVAAEGAFTRERDEATAIAGMTTAAEPELEALAERRWCQVSGIPVFAGRNQITFFIGPREEGASAAPAPLDEAQLPWEQEEATAFRLTVLFLPAAADAVAQEAELDLPRFGRSDDATFVLDVGADGTAAARILVLFRNRILQTALLTGTVGQPPELREVVALVPTLTALDDRRPFDLALFANHAGGTAQLTRHSDGKTQISAPGGIPAITERIAEAIGVAAIENRSLKQGLRSAAARELLVDLAVEGRDLFLTLSAQLGRIADATRIQLVTADSSWLLPLELAYERDAPDDGAGVCPNFLADPATCTGDCDVAPPAEAVCPNAFWGLSKTIERHRYDATQDEELAVGYQLVGSRQPRRGHRDLVVARALLGASNRVTPADTAATVAAFGAGAAAAKDWTEWTAALEGEAAQLLVLLPHTDYKKATLEIGKSTLRRGRIASSHVTGGRDEHPVVILFGCRTSGTGGDPAGFAERFALQGASAVFHSVADLRNTYATELARRLHACLIRPGQSPRLVSDALAQFRREAVRDGFVFALAISALGDADWRI